MREEIDIAPVVVVGSCSGSGKTVLKTEEAVVLNSEHLVGEMEVLCRGEGTAMYEQGVGNKQVAAAGGR